MDAAISGVVLAGGASRRMGADKALLELGGTTLIERVVETLLSITEDVVVAAGGGARPGWPALKVPVVPDRVTLRGPVAGLEAGLGRISTSAAIVVACDMPFLNPDLLRFLAEQLGRYEAIVPVVGGRQHPLHAVYSRECLPALEEVLLRGGSLHDLLARVRTKAIPEEDVLEIDPGGLSCMNVNEPGDWERVRALWEQRQHEVASS